MSITTFPNAAVCYILSDIAGLGEFQASGVIIGPHTILTAAHVLWNADLGEAADKVSIYPGFTPDTTTYNPPGALPGLQSIHYLKAADYNDQLTPAATQCDYAVINTSTDLSAFGKFALDPNYTGGDVVVNGYPASNDGNQSGTGGVLSKNPVLSDIGTSGLPISPGYSGGPLWDRVWRNGSLVPAVVGLVSTGGEAVKIDHRKVGLIRHWISSDHGLYAGGTDAAGILTPQIDGTVSGVVDAASTVASGGSATLLARASSGPSDRSIADLTAATPSFVYSDAPAGGASAVVSTPAPGRAFSDLVAAIHGGPSGDVTPSLTTANRDPGATLAAPVPVFIHGQGFGT